MKFLQYLEEAKIGRVPKTQDDVYGQEVIMDLHNCNVEKFTNKSIEKFLIEICDMTKMKRAELHWWEDTKKQEIYDEKNHPYLAGISCIQFIQTSNITIHTIIPWKKLFINFFTCKTFDAEKVKEYIIKYFEGEVVTFHNLERK